MELQDTSMTASTKNICSNLNMEGQAQSPGLNSIRINLLHNKKTDGGKAVFFLLKNPQICFSIEKVSFWKMETFVVHMQLEECSFQGIFL